MGGKYYQMNKLPQKKKKVANRAELTNSKFGTILNTLMGLNDEYV